MGAPGKLTDPKKDLWLGAEFQSPEEAVPGPSVFPSGEPGVSGDFWGSSCVFQSQDRVGV